MGWKWDGYQPQGAPNVRSPLLYLPSLPLYPGTTAVTSWGCTLKPSSSVFDDALGDWDRVNPEMDLEARIKWTRRCSWKPWLRGVADALGGQDRVNSEMELEVVIERVRRCSWRTRFSEPRDPRESHIERIGRYAWRPWSIKIGGVLGVDWSGGDWSGVDWSGGDWSGGDWSGGDWSGGDWFGGDSSGGGQSECSQSWGSGSECSESGGGRSWGMCDGRWDFIDWLTRNCGNVETCVPHGPLQDRPGAGDNRSWDNAVRSQYSPQGMEYFVYAGLGVHSWSWHGEIEGDDIT